jgi:hypothetical protein
VEIKSFSLVATHELKEEALLCVMAVRRVYPKVDILLFTDMETQGYLAERVKNVTFDLFCEPDNLAILTKQYSSVSVANRFHRVDCIAAKMPCITQACDLFGNTMFIDSDIVLLDEVHQDCVDDLTLSPHYHRDNRVGACDKYGVYNAGYVFAASGDVGRVWDQIYRERSTFFEQQGMIWFHEHFDTYHFPRTHNIGFWRCKTYYTHFPSKKGPFLELPQNLFDGAKSLHVHMTKFYEARADSGLTAVYDQWMSECDKVIRERAEGLSEEWEELK